MCFSYIFKLIKDIDHEMDILQLKNRLTAYLQSSYLLVINEFGREMDIVVEIAFNAFDGALLIVFSYENEHGAEEYRKNFARKFIEKLKSKYGIID